MIANGPERPAGTRTPPHAPNATLPPQAGRSASTAGSTGGGAPTGTPLPKSPLPGQGDAHANDGYGPPHPLDGLMAQVKELQEYATLYLQAKRDSYAASFRKLMITAAMGVVAAVVGITVLIVATVYLLSGMAAGLGWLFGERYALGQFVTGLTVLIVVGAVAFFGTKSLFNGSRKRTLDKYERRHAEERQQFGHDVAQRAQRVQELDRS